MNWESNCMQWENFPSAKTGASTWTCSTVTVPTGSYEIRYARFGVNPYTAWFWTVERVLIFVGTFFSLKAAQDAAASRELKNEFR
jgi:hypothetical protein